MASRRAAICGVMLLLPALLGMGLFGQPPLRQEAPETKERFDATVEDLEGVVVQVSHVSYDGELYLPVYQGKGLVTIPFGKISQIELGRKEKSRREVKISFEDETSGLFWLDEAILILGKVPYGTYQIQAKDLFRLRFIHPPAE